jgi:26S proteasome regulatory subunit N1
VSIIALALFFCVNVQFRYGEPCIRRAVPLGMAMLSVSNPQLAVVETLHKYSHDADAETAYNAILALGIVGAGMGLNEVAN